MKKKITLATLLVLFVFIGCQDETILSVEQNELKNSKDVLNSKLSFEGSNLYALHPWNWAYDDFFEVLDEGPGLYQNNIALYTYDPITDNIAVNENNTNYLEPHEYLGFDFNPIDNLVYLLRYDKMDDAKGTSKRYYNTRDLYSYNLETNEVEFIQPIISNQGNDRPQDLTFDSSGNLYFVFKNGEINKFDLNTMTMSAFANVPAGGAVGLTYNFDDNSLIYAYRDNSMFPVIEGYESMNTLIGIDIPSGNNVSLFSFAVYSNGDFDRDMEGCSASAQGIEYVGNNKCIAASTFGCDVIYTIDLITEETEILLNPTGSFENIKDLMLVGEIENDDYDNDGVINEKDRHPFSNTNPMLNLRCYLDTENQMVRRGTWMNDEIQDAIDMVNALEDVSDRKRTNKFRRKMYIVVNYWWYKYRLISSREKREILECINEMSYPFNQVPR